MHFSGLVAPDSYTGGEQGTDVSGDGSTLAYVLSDGSVRVIDLWTLSERAAIEPFTNSGEGYGIGYQVGLDGSGTRLVRVFVPEYPEDGELFQADLEIYDLAGDTAERTLAETVELSSYPAVAFGPEDGVVVVPEVEGTVSVVDLGDDRPDVVHLGTPEQRDDASLLEVYVSVDGSRVCTIGVNLQLYQVAERRQLLEVANDRFTYRCMPEPCGATPSNAMAVTRESDVECIAPDGSIQGRADANVLAVDPTVVALRGVDPDWKPGTRHRWLVEQLNGEAVDPPYWFVTAPDDAVRSLGLSYAVPMPGGPGIVGVGVDGDIDVWAIGAGVLPNEDELVAADGVSLLVGGQCLSSDRPLLALALEEPAVEATGEATLVDASSGEPATPVRSLDLGDTWYDQRHWVLPGGEILVHGADGHVEVHAEGRCSTDGVRPRRR